MYQIDENKKTIMPEIVILRFLDPFPLLLVIYKKI
jgi:hypothetical protein